MYGTVADDSARKDLAAFAYELAEAGGVLIVDVIYMLLTEDADLFLSALHLRVDTDPFVGRPEQRQALRD